MLITLDLKLLFKGSASFLVFNKLFKGQAVHDFLEMTLSVVDLDSIDLHGRGIYHFVSCALKGAFCKDNLPFELLAVVAHL